MFEQNYSTSVLLFLQRGRNRSSHDHLSWDWVSLVRDRWRLLNVGRLI